MRLWHTKEEAEKALAEGVGCQMHHDPTDPNDKGKDLKVVEDTEEGWSICCDNPDCIEDMLLK